ncbi:unnamed protein product [Owenia fusiformis]|uniref:Uncharacterized protein n=1 Tax=Owenia fusiformis TaxID=6347 RepID=A0A8J1U437_OWEFU|nr:unnamed protein product [Owenia fusiformis]
MDINSNLDSNMGLSSRRSRRSDFLCESKVASRIKNFETKSVKSKGNKVNERKIDNNNVRHLRESWLRSESKDKNGVRKSIKSIDDKSRNCDEQSNRKNVNGQFYRGKINLKASCNTEDTNVTQVDGTSVVPIFDHDSSKIDKLDTEFISDISNNNTKCFPEEVSYQISDNYTKENPGVEENEPETRDETISRNKWTINTVNVHKESIEVENDTDIFSGRQALSQEDSDKTGYLWTIKTAIVHRESIDITENKADDLENFIINDTESNDGEDDDICVDDLHISEESSDDNDNDDGDNDVDFDRTLTASESFFKFIAQNVEEGGENSDNQNIDHTEPSITKPLPNAIPIIEENVNIQKHVPEKLVKTTNDNINANTVIPSQNADHIPISVIPNRPRRKSPITKPERIKIQPPTDSYLGIPKVSRRRRCGVVLQPTLEQVPDWNQTMEDLKSLAPDWRKNVHHVSPNSNSTTENNSFGVKSKTQFLTKSDSNSTLYDISEEGNDDEHANNHNVMARHSSQTDLGTLKTMAEKLKLKTRRPSYVQWKQQYVDRPLLARLNNDYRVVVRENMEWTERKDEINKALAWLRHELIQMKQEDQILARQLVALRHEINRVRLEKSCDEHRETIDDAMYELEEQAEEYTSLCDTPTDLLSPTPLRQIGVTRMNITSRRFSVF